MIQPAIAFILVEPKESGNLGMVARGMANFGLSELVVVGSPDFPDGGDRTMARPEGREILERLGRAPDLASALAPFQAVVGVSRRQGKHRTLVLTPGGIGAFLEALPAGTRTAFVFGRESDGLRADEAALCGHFLSIPTTPESPSLNLAQAATIVAFTIHAAALVPPANPSVEPPASSVELSTMLEALEESLVSIGFLQGDRAADTMTSLRKLLMRALPTSREVRLLRSLARKVSRGGEVL